MYQSHIPSVSKGFVLSVRRQPLVAFTAIMLIDARIHRGGLGIVRLASLDWVAHLLTTALGLGALRRWDHGLEASAAMAGSVAIDVDHLPHWLGLFGLSRRLYRPYSHSLGTLAVLLLAARLPATGRTGMSGAAAGFGMHLLRDTGTSELSLWWPLSARAVKMPYFYYAVALALLALFARRDAASPSTNASV